MSPTQASSSRSRPVTSPRWRAASVCSRIKRQPGAWPYAAKLAKEKPDGDGPPTRQVLQRSDESRGFGEAPTDLPYVAVVLGGDDSGERLQPRRGAKIVAGVPTRIEQRHEGVPVAGTSIDDPLNSCVGELVESPFGDLRRDASSEQRGRHEPSLYFGVTSIQVDAYVKRIPTAEAAHDLVGKGPPRVGHGLEGGTGSSSLTPYRASAHADSFARHVPGAQRRKS